MIKLILILAFVICLTWIVLAFGGARSDGSAEGAVDSVEAIFGNAFQTNLRSSDLRSTQSQCKISGTTLSVPKNTSCRFSIAKGGFRTRTSAIAMQQGKGEMQFSPAASDDPRPEPFEPVDLMPSESKDISVYREGGTLTLKCKSSSDEAKCLFRLKPV